MKYFGKLKVLIIEHLCKIVVSYNEWPVVIRIIFQAIISFFIAKLWSYLCNINQHIFVGVLTAVLWCIWLIINYFANEYFKAYYPESNFLSNMRKIKDNINNNSIYDLFKEYSSKFVSSISNEINPIDQVDAKRVDLAFELASFQNQELKRNNGDIIITNKAISRIRRARILEICRSLLHENINTFYATECHLMDVISDNTKWDNDKKYREELQKTLSKIQDKNKKRIIIIKKSDYDRIKSDCKSKCSKRFFNYCKWHHENNWSSCLFLLDEDSHLELSTLGAEIGFCNDLTDFIFVEYKTRKQKETIVFAQNDSGLCKYFKRPSKQPTDPIDDYKNWFESVWQNEGNCNHQIIINDDFLKEFEK